ncbi:protein-serine/threonine phosphatase [Malassezia brasiliensis]|uniref:Protein-serine/threonine phosphatase n=1 Tax=Malassezia brasiliensis TaxID=1821822 RepID=A0AAF0DTT8_9BASI|nr:protein-serine/threonine phosphatase [Malassezia brasiliensis]
MEDAHMSLLDFDNVPGQALFGVFDGHAGKFAAEWCRDHLASILAEELHAHPTMDVREVLNNTYMRVDRQLEVDSEKAGVRSGCTAVTSLLRVESEGDKERRVLYTANVGDARSVLARNGKAVRLTYDHKGSDELEARRITEKGGFLLNNRVNGVLAVTRSFGDFSMKEFVVGSPFTTSIALEDNDAFLIVACDGLWDVIGDQEAVDHISNETDAQVAADKLLKYAMDNFSTDNTSVMVVRFQRSASPVMAVDSQAKPGPACRAPSDGADASPLDFSKRKLPPRLPLDAEDARAPARPRRMSLLSDALRSPLLAQDAIHAPKRSPGCVPGSGAGCTTGILKHNDDPHASQIPDEPRAPATGTRTHFVEPVKPPRRARSVASHTKSAPVSPQARKSYHRPEQRCPSVTFLEPHARARSTSPRMLVRSQVSQLDSALRSNAPDALGPAVSSASESDVDASDDESDSTSGEESDGVGDEEDESDEDTEASDMDELASSDEEASPPVPAGPIGRSPPLRTSSSSGPASLAQITKRRALSFSDTPPAATQTSQSMPRRRSLAFAASPFELKERDRLLSMHRTHGKRRMVASPMVSSTSSPATNLFDITHRVSSFDSEATGCSSDAADDDDGGRLQVRSPHLVQTRPRSPKPEEVASSEEDDEEAESSEDTTSSDEEADEEVLVEDEAPAPAPPSHRAAESADTSMDPCATWANESIDADADDTAPVSSASHTPEVACTCRATPRLVTRRRPGVLHSLMLTEPTMHYTGIQDERLDTADELALAAEMLLLHKSPDVERDAQEWTAASSVPRLSDDEGASSAEESTARSPAFRRSVGSPSMEACNACVSPQGSGFVSPQALCFRRGRNLQPHWRASTSPHHGRLSMDRRSRSDSVYPMSTPKEAPRLLRKSSYTNVTRSLHAKLSPPDPSVGERPAVSPRYV